MTVAEEFLKVAHLYQLGFLDTEKPHPQTADLSSRANSELESAVAVLMDIDFNALDVVMSKAGRIRDMRHAVLETFQAGGRVFLCGCGATGRLALLVESLYRETHPGRDDVFAFMAGGDVALVHSLEGFEDFPEYGARHLREMGFGEGDLLLASTEGGETPYVIGATLEAARLSKRKPWFLFCNRAEILAEKIERSRQVLHDGRIECLELFVGPMALAGSTRMQASTVLQLAVGFAVLGDDSDDFTGVTSSMVALRNAMAGVQKSRLARFIESESEVYTRGEFVFYLPELFQISVFTDTTERAPTFSLTPFSHDQATRLLARAPSFSYVSVAQAKSGAEAWRSLLNREPRPLNWHEIDPRTDENYLRAFDFGPAARDFRKRLTNGAVHHDFVISADERALKWSFRDSEIDFEWGRVASPLLMHTFLKMLLNIHSTLIMGRIGRYEGNLMTWVYPNNGKLIDRAARYVRILLERQGVTVSYEDVVRRLLEINRDLPSNTSVVLKTVEAFKGTR